MINGIVKYNLVINAEDFVNSRYQNRSSLSRVVLPQ